MPIKKSDLYSKLRASCDELRGGMMPVLLTGRIGLVEEGATS